MMIYCGVRVLTGERESSFSLPSNVGVTFQEKVTNVTPVLLNSDGNPSGSDVWV